MSVVPQGSSGFAAGPEAADLPDDHRLVVALHEFLGQLEAGRPPDRQEFLGRYPDLAEPLAQCLDGLELVHRAALKDRPATGSAPAGKEPVPADPLGDFKIVGEIGRGGMGIVYEAVQLSLGRRVALKVLPFAATFEAKHLQRFHKEAQAAAQLHHTNIVPVFAVGCERGVHFYAMQLIDGQSLAVVIHQLRQQAGRPEEVPTGQPSARDPNTLGLPRGESGAEKSQGAETTVEVARALSTQRSGKQAEFFRTAAGLLVQAAEAVDHAHQFGIVHRDLKPANLLLDVYGRLWITDFGLAQFHADAGLTQTGDVLGTLRYMSPEQASGQRILLDPRTDVYALGATLYEFLTLEPIFPGQNRQELLHQILHTEPRPPRLLEKAMPVELDTIILKAVSKSPGERYASAQELAADLRRYLEDKPIMAKRPTLVERGRKWARRHPSLVAAGMLLLVVCVAGLVVNNWMIAREQAKTRAALQREQQRAEEAEKQFKQARRAVDLLVQVSESELADVPPLETVRKRLLEAALGYYQEFIEQQQGDAGAQAELAGARNRVRQILDELSTLQGAHQLVLVTDAGVQKDLKLSATQRTQIARLDERWSEQRLKHFRDPRQATSNVRRQEFLELARTTEKELGAILDAAQLKRLRQIALQLQGSRAFRESHVIEALKLTTEQRRQVREIEQSQFAGPPPEPGEDGGPGDMRRHMEDGQRAAVERILALLSPPQRLRWQELTGEPFRGRVPFLWGGPPGPPKGFGPR